MHVVNNIKGFQCLFPSLMIEGSKHLTRDKSHDKIGVMSILILHLRVLERVGAMRRFHVKEENCSYFFMQPIISMFSAIHFFFEKKKENKKFN